MTNRKKNYIQSIPTILLFVLVIYIFDLPERIYVSVGIATFVSILIFEIFVFGNKNKD